MVKFDSLSAKQILEVVSGEVFRSSTSLDEVRVEVLCEPQEKALGSVSFLIAEAFLKEISETTASVLVVEKTLLDAASALIPPSVKVVISSPNAYLGLAKLSEVIAAKDRFADWRCDDEAIAKKSDGSAWVHSSAQIDATAKVGANAIVCDRAVIGARAVVLPGAVVGPGVEIGEDSVIFPGAVLYPRTKIGKRTRIHANVVLGGDGFGYARTAKGAVKIWHLGSVVVGDDVEIGPGTAVDRGTIKDTIIENGAKIDNLVQIGHNGFIRSHAILCAQTGLAGNVTVGRGAILAGKVGVGDKVKIGDGAIVGGGAGVAKDVAPGEVVMGALLARPKKQWWRLMAYFSRLPELFERVKKLEGK